MKSHFHNIKSLPCAIGGGNGGAGDSGAFNSLYDQEQYVSKKTFDILIVSCSKQVFV